MEQIWEGVLRDGLEGLPLGVQSRFECLHGFSGHNILWQLVPVWDYSDVERIIKQTKKGDLPDCGIISFIPRKKTSS